MLSHPVPSTIEIPQSRTVPTREVAGSIGERFARASLRTLHPHELLFREGDAKTLVYQVAEGAFVLYKLLPNGRRQVTGFALPGDIVDLSAVGQHVCSAEASGPAKVRSLPFAVLMRLAAEEPGLALKLYQSMSQELARAHDLLMTVGRLDAAERVATFLLGLSRHNERSGRDAEWIELPMTRCDIGDLLGLTTETVSRTLTKLANRQFIARFNGKIRILDTIALQGVAADGLAS